MDSQLLFIQFKGNQDSDILGLKTYSISLEMREFSKYETKFGAISNNLFDKER